MSIAQVSVVVDQEVVKNQINEKLDETFREVMFTWDVQEMMKRMCMGRTFLEEEILRDPRMRLIQRQKEKGKRFWFYEESKVVIKQIMDEW